MKKTILGLLAAGLMLTAGTQQAEAQVRVHIPGTGVNVRVGDPQPNSYNNRYNDGYYYNRYNRGYWVDNRGFARYNNGYYTGWRGNTYYDNGRAVRVRNGRNVIWIR